MEMLGLKFTDRNRKGNKKKEIKKPNIKIKKSTEKSRKITIVKMPDVKKNEE